MRNPQKFYNTMEGMPIVFGLFSATKTLAEADEYNILTGIMMTSPFFKKMSKAKEGSGPETYLRLPKGIIFTFGSRATHALGMNILGGLMDETSWTVLTGHTQMTELYKNIWRRLVSRYSNAPSPGLLILCSSKQSRSDFTQEHIAQWEKETKMVKITRNFALYEIKPWDFPTKGQVPRDGRRRRDPVAHPGRRRDRRQRHDRRVLKDIHPTLFALPSHAGNSNHPHQAALPGRLSSIHRSEVDPKI
jgi:hypothetical protein